MMPRVSGCLFSQTIYIKDDLHAGDEITCACKIFCHKISYESVKKARSILLLFKTKQTQQHYLLSVWVRKMNSCEYISNTVWENLRCQSHPCLQTLWTGSSPWDSSSPVSPFSSCRCRTFPGSLQGSSLSVEHQLSALTGSTECFLSPSAAPHYDRAFTVFTETRPSGLVAALVQSRDFCLVHFHVQSEANLIWSLPSVLRLKAGSAYRLVNKRAGIRLHRGSQDPFSSPEEPSVTKGCGGIECPCCCSDLTGSKTIQLLLLSQRGEDSDLV